VLQLRDRVALKRGVVLRVADLREGVLDVYVSIR